MIDSLKCLEYMTSGVFLQTSEFTSLTRLINIMLLVPVVWAIKLTDCLNQKFRLFFVWKFWQFSSHDLISSNVVLLKYAF